MCDTPDYKPNISCVKYIDMVFKRKMIGMDSKSRLMGKRRRLYRGRSI